ncbi:MAG: T9SS type A sorting domain-containing protein, partial [Bacteroidia bacterium]
GRGTGYNNFNGTSWGQVTNNRIEQYRAGYPALDYSSVLNKEIIFSHKIDTASRSGGLLFNTNMTLGSSTWSAQVVLDTPSVTTHCSVLWPRIAVSGNYIHVIGAYTSPTALQPDSVIMSNVREPNVYSRYNIATSSWEVKNTTLPYYNGTRWYSGSTDAYSIDAQGSNVAILIGGLTNDISFWKSTDNGTTWSYKIIDSFSVAAFNYTGFLDTTICSDGSVNVKLDASGKAHCFWGRAKVVQSTTPGSISLYLAQNAIDYWYEGRGGAVTPQIAYCPDLNNNGQFDPGTIDGTSRYGNLSACTMPAATMDSAGNIFLVYSGLTEDDIDGSGHSFRDVFCVYSINNGLTWSAPRDLTGQFGANEEQMFASVPQSITNNLQLTYMESTQVGFYNSSSTNGNPSKTGSFDIIYTEIPVADIINNVVGIEDTKNEQFTLSQNFPNPFKGTTTFPVTLNSSSDVSITVMNVMGQVVSTNKFEKASSGVHNFEIDLSNLNSGVYFYTVESNGYKMTKRMMVD